jgi:hypothetical protein
LRGIPGFAVEGGSGETGSTGKEEAFSTVDASITMGVFAHTIFNRIRLTTVQQVTSTNHSVTIVCNQIVAFFASNTGVGMGVGFETILDCSGHTKTFIAQVVSRDTHITSISEEVS